MVSVTALIDKLTEIQRSIGVESEFVIHKQVLDAQDCVLQLQAEIAQVLRIESRQNTARMQVTEAQNAVRLAPALSWEPRSHHSGWQRAVAAILPFAAASSLWRR